MKARHLFSGLIVAVIALASTAPITASANPLYRPTNVSPYPSLTNEFYLTATNITTSINGTNVRVFVYKDDPPGGGGVPMQIPGPLVEATVGQTIICHFRNSLTNNIEGASIHWHGIELDNDSDGTAVTQDTILSGQTYTYRFVVTRPGLYWYHSHMLPGTTAFGGMYGPMIVRDPNETALIAANVLPSTNYTFPLVLTDISFANGAVGKVVGGTNYSLNALILSCEDNVLSSGGGSIIGACGAAGTPGDVFLCNGSVPIRNGTLNSPTTNSSPVFYIGKNQRIRLQIFNESISRNAYLTLKYPTNNPTGNTNLYHIGGQGGLLDNAVLDGGVQSGYDFQYKRGMVNLGSGMREDVMFYSSGNAGDVIQLLGQPLGGNWQLTTSGTVGVNYPVAFFVITNGGSTNLPLFVGSPILSAIGVTNEDLRVFNTNSLAPPPTDLWGTVSPIITLSNSTSANGVAPGPSIGGYAATALDGNSGNGSWPDVPHPPTALWARAGDVVQLAIANNTGGPGSNGGQAVHPYHLHGFSMQPIAIYSANLQTNLFNFPYVQYVDTWDILPGEALVFRIKLEDRPVLADTATGGPLTTGTDSAAGGNLGRWLMHCHIFLHGAIGMISELVVAPNTVTRLVGPSAGTNSVISTSTSSWIGTTNAPWLHLMQTNGSGRTTVRFTHDANPGPTRFGTLNIGGETVEVTQAGTNYVKAPGPLTGLVTNGINAPFAVAVGEDGDVFFTDSANGAVKRWNRTANTVTTLSSGWNIPYGVGLDRLGNVYFSQFGNAAIKKRLIVFPITITLFTNDTASVAGLAVDEAANVYIAVPGEHVVKKWDSSTSTLTTYTTNGLISPYGVAVSKSGGIYASDVGDDSVKLLGLRIVSTSPLIIIPYWNTVVTSPDLSNPYNLAVDDGGNIFIADFSHNAIKKFSAASNTVTTAVSGLNGPTGVAVDNTGNLFIAEWTGDAIRELPYAFVDPTPQNEPAELTVDKLSVILPPDENLLPPFAPKPNSPWIFYGGSTTGVVQFAVGANVGGPRSGSLTVLGQPITINQEGASGGVAITNLLVGPAAGSNTVTEYVIPTIGPWTASTATPWLHLPVVSGTGGGNVLFTYDANLGATRVGTLTINGKTVTVTQAGATYVPVLPPATTLVSTGLVSPVSVAPDKLGNVVFSDNGINTVFKWTPGSTGANPIFGGFVPQGVAVDAVGNIYVSDLTFGAIKQWRAADSNVVMLVDTPFSPQGLSLGYDTNIYWGMPGNHSVNKWIASPSNSITIVATNLTSPYGVAVDIAGNIYIADTGANAIKKWNPATATLTTLATAFLSSPWNVGVDGSGNVYVANGGGNNIVKWVAASSNVVVVVPSGLTVPTDVKPDANGNLFIADLGNGAVKKLPHAFVDPSARNEPATAGSDTLPVVLPPNVDLLPPFTPVSSQPWLTIASVAGGTVSFDFTANTNSAPRSATITLLGRNIPVNQAGMVYPPLITAVSISGKEFQFNFTNGTPGAVYSVLFTTNLAAPLADWIEIGTVSQEAGPVWQFTDKANNETGFYRVRSP